MVKPKFNPNPIRDESLLAALRIPAKLSMCVWLENLRKHEKHRSFRATSNALTLEYGFTCSCTGNKTHFNIDVRTLKERLPEAREEFDRFLTHMWGPKPPTKSERRARALLFRYLTREQKASLRAKGFFEAQGQDGHSYRIAAYNGIKRVEQGVETWSYCFHAEEVRLPSYDLMLAQKLFIENDIKSFLETANATDLSKKNEPPENEPPENNHEPDPLWDSIREEDLNDIAGWAAQHLGRAT